MAGYPKYCPEFRVEIDGESLPPALWGCMGSVTYQNSLKGADRVDVTFANPDLRWLDHPLLQVDKGFKLFIGYVPEPLEEVFVGEITGVEPSFPNNGMPTVTVVAHDFLQRLTHGAKDRAFRLSIPSIGNFPLPDALVAAIVSATNLLIPEPDPVGGALSVVMTIATMIVAPQLAQLAVPLQVQQSDFDFLSELARNNGWEMYIDHTAQPRGYVLRFNSFIQAYEGPSLTLEYGSSLLDFHPRITTVGDIFGVSVRIWVPSVQMEFVIVVSWDYDRAAFNLSIYPGLGQIDEILGLTAAAKTIAVEPIGFPQCLQSILAELLPRLNNRLTGSGSTVGDPRTRASRVIKLEGLGEQFGGLYRITSATHTLDSGGYRTRFDVRKDVWFGSIPVPKGASGLLRVQGRRVT